MISTLADRLKEAMKGPPVITGVALAKACGCSPASVSGWLSGDSKTMEASNNIAAAKLLNVDPDWLANGIGLKGQYPLWRGVEQEPAVYELPEPQRYLASTLLGKIPVEQLPQTISFLKWQLATLAPPSNGQAVPMAEKRQEHA